MFVHVVGFAETGASFGFTSLLGHSVLPLVVKEVKMVLTTKDVEN